MSWIEIFNGTFWITIATLFTGSIALCIKYSLKSKCDLVKVCWGLLVIHRNVELETDDLEIKTDENNL
jgi:hypothetical protein